MGLPTELVIKKGNSDFFQPLDYLGIPFRCFRCHEFGHLPNDCSLPFNKHSSSKVWRVKKDGTQTAAKAGVSVDENLDLHSISPDFEPLANLKQLSISNSLDVLDKNLVLNLSTEALSSSVRNWSLKDLGFVSPCKAIVSKGYNLRSCSKSVQETTRPVKDKPGNHVVGQDLIRDENVLHPVKRSVGALRAYSFNLVSL